MLVMVLIVLYLIKIRMMGVYFKMKLNKKLALGVLMGCLITGNMALAAEIEGPFVAHDGDGVNYETKNLVDTDIVVNGNVLGLQYGTIEKYGQAGATNGVLALCGGTVNLGDEKTETITVNVTGKWVDAVMADRVGTSSNGGIINVETENFIVNADSTEIGGYCHAIRAMNRTTTSDEEDVSKIIINAANTVVNASILEGESNGLTAWSQGQIKINNGNLTVIADNVINTRGESLIEINADNSEKHVIKLNGDIEFKFDGQQSGTTIDSNVILNLNNSQSYFNGNIGTASNVTPIPGDKKDVFGMNLGLGNGGTWNTDATSFVNNLTFDGGVININGGEGHTVMLENITGTGGDINIKTETADGKTFEAGSVDIGKDENSTIEGKIDVNFTGITADDVKDGEAALKELAGKIDIKGTQGSGSTSANIAEGLLSGAITGNVGNSGIDNIQQNTSTATMDGMRDIGSIAIAAWRQEDSTLGQRLGELRNSEGDQGIWTRMSRGEFEYDGNFKNQYNFFQIGYDKAYGDWHYGAAISHNDGKTSYAQGSGENRSTSLSLYGTWLGESGEYADIVLKQGRLSNDFDIYTAAGHTYGDYDMWGTSLSGEYGKKIDMNDGWYITPQGQLTFMYIGGEDYTTANGISAEQDSMTSLVGRVGFEMGKAVSDKGSVYAMASLLHEFDGEADTHLTLGDKHNRYSRDLGDTWCEAGIGFNYKVSDASYVYADVVKTFGGDLETPWQWNAGMRWTF